MHIACLRPMSTTAVRGERRNESRQQLGPLKLLHSYREAIQLMEQWVRAKSRGAPLAILEAGCGTTWPLKLDGIPYAVTGVDLDQNALELRRRSARQQERLLQGDLRTRALFGSEQFDVIYNSFVLEHVDGAQEVLDNFLEWLKPGGILILRVPDRDSVYGFLARSTPFWLHVLIKKYAYNFPNAGKPGYDPFPTFYDRVISRRGLHEYCRKRGCVVAAEAGSGNYLPKHPLLRLISRGLVIAVSLASLGRLEWRHSNLTLLIEKRRG